MKISKFSKFQAEFDWIGEPEERRIAAETGGTACWIEE